MTVTSDRGTYVEVEGRPAVRFARTYPHPLEKVWAAISDPERVIRWFPSAIGYEPVEGGRIEFTGDPHLPATEGEILAYEPPTRFAFTWGADELHLELTPVDGGCRLQLLNILAEKDAAARNSTGWTVCLGVLTRLLDGQDVRGPHADDVPPFQPIYDAYVAAGMPSGAHIPGVD